LEGAGICFAENEFILNKSADWWKLPYSSGNNPGIQRPASLAGNANCKGARVLTEISAPLSSNADVTRRALCNAEEGDSIGAR
jgi:hypothetical protein